MCAYVDRGAVLHHLPLCWRASVYEWSFRLGSIRKEMEGEYEEGTEYVPKQSSKQSNVLPLWGNERTMNLNPLILTNIQSSHYFKVNLYELKTYHEVVDEIYYQVSHLEPWEKGSRRTSGQTGMCGGVRGVGAGGIVSTAYCLLYKLFTLKLTRKQINGLLTHGDSPYIRALGFMYIRYTQHPQNLLDWFDPYLEDEEELDVKAGGGQNITIGQMLRQWLVKLEWFSTLFPRIPVPIQQRLQKHLQERFPTGIAVGPVRPEPVEREVRPPVVRNRFPEPLKERPRERDTTYKDRGNEKDFLKDRSRDRDIDREKHNRDERFREPRYRGGGHDYDRIRDRSRDRERERRTDRHHGSKHRERHRHASRDKGHSRERDHSSKSRSRR